MLPCPIYFLLKVNKKNQVLYSNSVLRFFLIYEFGPLEKCQEYIYIYIWAFQGALIVPQYTQVPTAEAVSFCAHKI